MEVDPHQVFLSQEPSPSISDENHLPVKPQRTLTEESNLPYIVSKGDSAKMKRNLPPSSTAHRDLIKCAVNSSHQSPLPTSRGNTIQIEFPIPAPPPLPPEPPPPLPSRQPPCPPPRPRRKAAGRIDYSSFNEYGRQGREGWQEK